MAYNKGKELTEEQEQKLLAAIDAKLSNAYGGDNDTALSRHRQKLIEAYLGLNVNPAPEGRSQVVDRSVYETVQTMLPSLVRIFAASSDEICKFVPIGPEDEPGAELTTAYVNWVVGQKNPWEQILADWIFDALLLPNSYAMAYWDDVEQNERETYEGQTDDQVAFLMQDPEVEVVEAESYPDPNYTPQPQMDQMTGQQIMPPMLHDVTVERKDGYGCATICTLPPEHCIVDGDTPDWTLQHAKYFEYREEKTIAELRAMGLEVDDNVSDDIETRNTDEDFSRDRFAENNFDDDDGSGLTRKVVTRSIWIEADLEDDVQFYYVIAVGRTILYCEPCGRIPVASMVSQPMPHRHPGMSVAETILDQQDIKTAIKRGGLDNLYLANNGRHVISDKVNLEDFLDSRPGGVVRMIDGSLPGQGHVVPLVHPFAFDQIVGAMEYFDQERQNRSGVSRYFSGTDAGAINRTASGISQLTNAAAQRVEHIARMMSPAVEYLFSIVHELILKHNNKREMVKLKGQWTPIDPRSWQTKRDVRISVGVGAGNKDSLLAQLNVTFQEQMMLAQSPLGIVKPDNIYQTLLEKAKLNGYANPQRFYTDPNTNPPPPQGPPPQMVVEMKKLEHDAQKSQFEAQKAAETKQLELQHDAQKTQFIESNKLQIAQLQSQTQQVLQMMQDHMTRQQQAMDQQAAAHNNQLEQHKLQMSGVKQEMDFLNKMQGQREQAVAGMNDMTDKFSKMAEGFSKAITDLQAKIEGGRTVGVERTKGPDGRMTGARVLHADGTSRDVKVVDRAPNQVQ